MKHMGVTKEFLILAVRQYGTDEIMPGFTVDEAVAAIEADPRKIFTGCNCVKTPDGSCTGQKPDH